jgi:hypothetical protein
MTSTGTTSDEVGTRTNSTTDRTTTKGKTAPAAPCLGASTPGVNGNGLVRFSARVDVTTRVTTPLQARKYGGCVAPCGHSIRGGAPGLLGVAVAVAINARPSCRLLGHLVAEAAERAAITPLSLASTVVDVVHRVAWPRCNGSRDRRAWHGPNYFEGADPAPLNPTKGTTPQ